MSVPITNCSSRAFTWYLQNPLGNVSPAQKRVSMIVNFEGKILKKMDLSRLTTNEVVFGNVFI